MAERQIKHFRVLEKIGAGGMGEVFRAHDERLARDVALKFLPAHLFADEAARKRFRREALSLSRLDHPNVVTVFDFDTDQGVDFLAMSLVPGESLDQRLLNGALSQTDVLQMGAQILEGLAAAHDAGIVHRDLKPGNVRLTPDGRLKILDFGLASLRGREIDTTASTGSLEAEHLVVGTPPYMAPEQIRGDKVDARSDIYAVGAMLYEMCTGRRAFPERGARLVEAILMQMPPTPREINAAVSPSLEFIILKALEKDPARRYQTAREMLLDIERLRTPSSSARTTTLPRPARPRWLPWSTAIATTLVIGVLAWALAPRWLRREAPAAEATIRSLAVLPLENLSNDSEQEYFADGMTEALIADLARIKSLKVISRTSVMVYKKQRKPLPDIARELNVDAIIEGSVLRSGARVRITAQLIHARTDQHLWVEHYERDLKDVLALQGEVARAIAAEVRAQVTPQEQARLGSKRAVPPDAYEAYLKGRYHWNQARVANYQQAVEFFERALKVMPDYGPAQAGLAGSFLSLAANEMDRAQQARSFELARRAAQRAIDLDGNDAEALSILGRLRLYADWDFMGAAEAIERAVQRDPNNSSARTSHGLYLCLIGRYDEAIVAHRQALEIDPLSISLNHQLAWTYWHAQRLDEAIAQARQTLELNPNHASSRAYLALSFAMQKKRDAALAEQRLIAGYNSGHVALALGATIEAIAGQREVAQKLLAQARHAGWTDPEGIACVYALLGERERVFEWLERGYQERAPMMIWIRADPLLASVRTDPRFASLLERMRYPD